MFVINDAFLCRETKRRYPLLAANIIIFIQMSKQKV